MSNDTKRRVEEAPKLVIVQGFIEHAFPLWSSKVSLDRLANSVFDLASVDLGRAQCTIGHNGTAGPTSSGNANRQNR